MEKIVLCIPSLEYGGAERVTVRLANCFCEKKHVYVITNRICEKEYLLDSKVNRININSENAFVFMKCFRNKMKELNPEFVIVMFAPMYILIYLSMLGLKFTQIVSERNDPKHFAGKKIVKFLYQYFLKKADGIVFQTKEAKEYFLKNDYIANRVIYNPVDVSELPQRYNGKKEKVIVSIGRLHYQKNQKLLIDAFVLIHQEIKDYKLTIYGEGELREELELYINKCNAQDFIELFGNSDDVLNEIKNKALFVLSSDFEGMPNALLEAMCLGLPVISTDCPCGGPSELIINNKNGILVSVGNKEELSNAILYLIKNPIIANKLGDAAYKIRDTLDIKKIAEQWLEFCYQVKEKVSRC